MKRSLYNELILWKQSVHRKPMIIRGARQVGKTWLMRTFGLQEYKKCVYLNCENNIRIKNIFTEDFDIQRIISALEIESGQKITMSDTLLIFDEIQEVPEALTSLKYFQEEVPALHILAAGSLLGVAMHPNSSFPVGKVDFLDLAPLSFVEFLWAMKEDSLSDLLNNQDWTMIKAFKSRYTRLLRQYYYIGGMPEVVLRFTESKEYAKARSLQQKILFTYEQDFSKHAPRELIPRIRLVWNSIPSQLAKENKKFIYGTLKNGARAREFELAIQWLIDSGLVCKVNRVNKSGIPLMAYEDFGAFKLFLADVGLMSAMADLDVKTLLEGNAAFEEFKGSLTEQYVHQQLRVQKGLQIYYWSAESSTSEIDFLVQYEGKNIPIEVKATENLQAKSLKVFHQKYKPERSVRISMSDYREDGWLTNLPLYAAGNLSLILAD